MSMAVVAVFEIHIDKNIVGSIKPNMSSLGLVPMVMRALRAILWWRLHFSTAMAAIREPATQGGQSQSPSTYTLQAAGYL